VVEVVSVVVLVLPPAPVLVASPVVLVAVLSVVVVVVVVVVPPAHAPDSQVWSTLQGAPQAPQFNASVFVSTHAPLQRV
jgi:hypothetical protein